MVNPEFWEGYGALKATVTDVKEDLVTLQNSVNNMDTKLNHIIESLNEFKVEELRHHQAVEIRLQNLENNNPKRFKNMVPQITIPLSTIPSTTTSATLCPKSG